MSTSFPEWFAPDNGLDVHVSGGAMEYSSWLNASFGTGPGSKLDYAQRLNLAGIIPSGWYSSYRYLQIIDWVIANRPELLGLPSRADYHAAEVFQIPVSELAPLGPDTVPTVQGPSDLEITKGAIAEAAGQGMLVTSVEIIRDASGAVLTITPAAIPDPQIAAENNAALQSAMQTPQPTSSPEPVATPYVPPSGSSLGPLPEDLPRTDGRGLAMLLLVVGVGGALALVAYVSLFRGGKK